jgi:hypothetical protein
VEKRGSIARARVTLLRSEPTSATALRRAPEYHLEEWHDWRPIMRRARRYRRRLSAEPESRTGVFAF